MRGCANCYMLMKYSCDRRTEASVNHPVSPFPHRPKQFPLALAVPYGAMLLRILALVMTLLGAEAGPGLGVATQVGAGSGTGPGGWGWASTANCTWKYITQPLDHFGDTPHTFPERYCIYDGFWAKAERGGFSDSAGEMAPIFFYTGNESPIEPYVNNTGLMWNLGRKLGALIVFAEHRYEGKSLPPLEGVEDCIAYGTTAQAIADYVALVEALRKQYATKAPVVAFGAQFPSIFTLFDSTFICLTPLLLKLPFIFQAARTVECSPAGHGSCTFFHLNMKILP